MSFKYKEEAQKVAKKLNISSISWIGEGEYGAAYETQDGRVLKITSDPNEFIYSSKLAGQKNENLVDVHDAFFIEDDLFAELFNARCHDTGEPVNSKTWVF